MIIMTSPFQRERYASVAGARQHLPPSGVWVGAAAAPDQCRPVNNWSGAPCKVLAGEIPVRPLQTQNVRGFGCIKAHFGGDFFLYMWVFFLSVAQELQKWLSPCGLETAGAATSHLRNQRSSTSSLPPHVLFSSPAQPDLPLSSPGPPQEDIPTPALP